MPEPDARIERRRARIAEVRRAMGDRGVAAGLFSVGADLPWLCGYEAMPLERLTMLVVREAGDPVLVVPGLEAPRIPAEVVESGLVEPRPWGETEDPIAIVAGLVAGAPGALAVSDRTWSVFLVALQDALPQRRWIVGSELTLAARRRKDAHEIAALAAAAAAADRVASDLRAGEVPVLGRSERAVSAEISERLIAYGHDRVNFAIVASGPNAASPHHEPGDRVIGRGDTVVCDFGGTLHAGDWSGYCSDITRTIVVGEPSAEVARCYAALEAAQAAGREAAGAGVAAGLVDRACREVLAEAGLAERFVHRTGHGIGVDEHEAPFLVEGSEDPLAVGDAFSVEPGVYVPDRFGMRLEDILVVREDGSSESLNAADRGLIVLEG